MQLLLLVHHIQALDINFDKVYNSSPESQKILNISNPIEDPSQFQDELKDIEEQKIGQDEDNLQDKKNKEQDDIQQVENETKELEKNIQSPQQNKQAPQQIQSDKIETQDQKRQIDKSLDEIISTQKSKVPRAQLTAPLVAISNSCQTIVMHYLTIPNMIFTFKPSSNQIRPIKIFKKQSNLALNNEVIQISFISKTANQQEQDIQNSGIIVGSQLEQVRCTLVDKQLRLNWHLDVNLVNGQVTQQKIDKDFNDDQKSIFKYGLMYHQYFESLTRFMNLAQDKQQLLKFPQKSTDVVIGFDKQDQVFFVYDIFKDKIIRLFRALWQKERINARISQSQNLMNIQGSFLDTVRPGINLFAVHSNAEFILIANGNSIIMKRLLIAEGFSRYVRPLYYTDQSKLVNSIDAKISYRKQLAKIINDV